VSLVFFFESGRLGNQLMQYGALRGIFPQAGLVLVGLPALRRLVDCEGTRFVPAEGLWRWPAGALRRLLGACARLRLVCEAWEVREGEDCRIEQRRGLLRGLVLVRPAYFHHPRFERLLPRGFDIRPAEVEAARRYLREQGAEAGDRTPFFVHLRRGDYLNYPDPAAPAALTREWTLAALAEARRRVPDARWVVCSDDVAYARELFAGDDALFCERGECGDLAVMSVCRGGILSPSSYSWWAAWLARQRLLAQGAQGLFFAPRYWIGHRRGQWYPAGFEFPWIDYR
jgi:Glycosyl transferase family 11